MSEICHCCGDEYERLTMHWNRSECERKSFTNSQIEILKGLLMGDGDLHRRKDPNPLFRVRMTNQEFLEYLDRTFEELSRGVFLARTATEMAKQARENQQQGLDGFETVNEDNYQELYGLRTVSHPDLKQFVSWYRSGKKRFPTDLRLTPELTRMWYVCDGWLAVDSKSTDSPRVMIKAANEKDRAEYLIELFEEAGFNAGFSRESIQISAHDTPRLLEWMGRAPPGFQKKWNMPA